MPAINKFLAALLSLIVLYCYPAVLVLVLAPAQAQAQDSCAEFRIAQEDLRPESTNSDPIPYSDSMLWRISKEGTPPSHLFGTIHIDSLRLTQLPQAVRHAFSNSAMLLTHLIPAPRDPAIALSAMLFRKEDTLQLNHLLPRKIYRQLEEILYPEVPGIKGKLPLFQPWGVYLLLHQQLLRLKSEEPTAEKQSEHVLDRYLQEDLATEHRLQVRMLENLKEQLEVLSNLSLEDQLFLLQETVCNIETIRGEYVEMLKLYLAGNMEKLTDRNMTIPYPKDQLKKRASYENLMERLIHQRNQRIARRLLPYLARGRVFIAVNVLHLPGEGGLVDRMTRAGYTVRPIPVKWIPPKESFSHNGTRFTTTSAPAPSLP